MPRRGVRAGIGELWFSTHSLRLPGHHRLGLVQVNWPYCCRSEDTRHAPIWVRAGGAWKTNQHDISRALYIIAKIAHTRIAHKHTHGLLACCHGRPFMLDCRMLFL